MDVERNRLALDLELARDPGAQNRVRNAIYHAGELGEVQLAPQILNIGQSNKDERILETAAWTLGKLGYHPAQALLQRLLLHPNRKVVRGAAWALGELGNERSKGPLRRIYEQCEDAELRQIVGGALRKVAGLPTRVYAASVEKRLVPPVSARTDINSLVKRLEQFDFEKDRSEVLRLRRELQELDPTYFHAYMEHRSKRTSALSTLASNRVYSRKRKV